VLIRHERQQRGTVDHTPVYPREVVKRALDLAASALILVHNHPSGDPTPSTADIAVTQDIKKAGAALGVVLHDHVIIGRNRHASLRDLGLIRRFREDVPPLLISAAIVASIVSCLRAGRGLCRSRHRRDRCRAA